MEAIGSLLPFGQVLKTFGSTGELVVKLTVSENLDCTKPVFMIIDGLPVPFFLLSVSDRRVGAHRLAVRFENIDTEARAAEFVGRTLYCRKACPAGPLPEDLAAQEQDLLQDGARMTGFAFADLTTGRKGRVAEFYDFPSNPCIALQTDEDPGNTVLLPLRREFFHEIDPERRTLVLKTPPGLFRSQIFQ